MTAKDLAEGVSGYTDTITGPSGIFYYLITITAKRIYPAVQLLIIA
ncbi:MAG TPA: hypothetical protein VHJ59_00205 [Nitrososphaera sp.]|nr:hypothetical protein [Nitrososphaera sp.]